MRKISGSYQRWAKKMERVASAGPPYKTRELRVKKTPNCAHRYTATMKGVGTYGYGDTPNKARASFWQQLYQTGQVYTVLVFPGDPPL